MTADWDALVDAAPPEVREALDRLRHHVVLTACDDPDDAYVLGSDSARAARDAMGAVLAWASEQEVCADA